MRRLILFLLSLFCGWILQGTENEPLMLEVGGGYGQEKVVWKSLSDTEPRTLNFRESYRKLHFLESIAALRSIQYDFYFFLEGGYAYVFPVRLKEQLLINDVNAYLSCKAKGYQAHSFFLFGYEVDLTPDRFSHFFLTPLVGYGGFWKKLREKNGAEDHLPTLFVEQEHSSLKQTWFGPYLGGGVFAQPDKLWRFEISYLFGWLHLRHSSRIFFDFLTPLEQGNVLQKEKDKKLAAFGHLARAKLFYDLAPSWRASIVADYRYFSTKDPLITRTVQTQEVFPISTTTSAQLRDRLHAWEYALSFLLDISYAF